MRTAAQEETFFVLLPHGEKDGPYELAELREMLSRGLIGTDTEIQSSKCGCTLHVDELLHHGQTDTIDEITGLNGLGGFSLAHFFADVFRLFYPFSGKRPIV